LAEVGPAELYESQIAQVQRDQTTAAALDSLSDIDDSVSRDVRLMYEESPYPPWTGTYRVKAAPFERHLGTDILPCRPPADIDLDRPDVLIAGCGTGKHAIESAMRYVDCRMLAVDLSRRSLAYGKRKAAEFDMDNIEFLQADILDLPKLDRQFDVIESVGVLHHMADPWAGLAALMSVLKPGGFLKLGLYSELGRQSVVAAREFVAEGGFGSGPDGIRKARQAIFALPADHPAKNVTEPLDFYSLSAVRDYLFHIQEHRLSLPEIGSALDAHGLAFLGFVLDVGSLRSFGAMFPEEGSFLSLENWHRFEEGNPNTFSAMYQFWTRKTDQS
jgi:SAM-dependent methyltransferase